MDNHHSYRRLLATVALVLAVIGVSAQQTVTVPSYIPDADSLAWHYIQKALAPKKNVQYGAFGYTTLLGEKEGKIYSMLYPVIQQIAAGDRTSTEIELDLSSVFEKTTFTASDLGVSRIVSGGNITEAAQKQVSKLFDQIDLTSVIHALINACPYEFYWYDKTKGCGWQYPAYSYTSQEVTIVPKVVISFYVSEDYQGDDLCSVNPQYGKSLTAATNIIADIIELHKNESDYQKLVSYQREIHDLVDYNDEAADDANHVPYGNPWQMIWVFDGDPSTKVVCEGYSKAFQYLCDMSDFKGDVYAICVSGQMIVETGGGHMWNIVHIDGKNYMVDVTNSDEGTVGYPDYLFLDGYAVSQNDAYYYTVYSSYYAGYSYDSYTKNLFTAEQLELSDTRYIEPLLLDIADAEISDIQDVVYNGESQTPSITVMHGTVLLTEGTDYEITSYTNNFNFGTATVTISGIGIYEGSNSKNFNILQRSIADASISTIADVVYTGTAFSPDFSVTLDNKTLSSTSDYDFNFEDNVNVGTAKLTITGKGNYSGTITKNFNISAISIANAEVTDIQDFVYTGEPLKPAFDVILDSKKLDSNTDYDFNFEDNVNVGTAKLTITGKGNYSGTITKNFNISAASIAQATVTGVKDFEYTGEALTFDFSVTLDNKTLSSTSDYDFNFEDNVNVG
ncbi:MAG: hypothetical protein II075_10470, partial [Bacteroidales bacterium]|nr:hypothetical protein [Bacteroidales bacterium]